MAKLYIREYKDVAIGPHGLAQIPDEGANVVDQTPVTIGAEAKSSAFAAGTCLICIASDAIFSYSIGESPTATTNMVRFPADTVLFLGVQPGQKISVIANT